MTFVSITHIKVFKCCSLVDSGSVQHGHCYGGAIISVMIVLVFGIAVRVVKNVLSCLCDRGAT